MSELLDPMHRRYIESLGIGPGARTLEVGFGNGSVSAWLAGKVAPGGRAVAVDIDLSLANPDVGGLELREADIVAGPVEPADFDLVTGRAVLHHLSAPDAAVANMVASARPGAAVLLIEPDFLPVTISARRRYAGSGMAGSPGRARRALTSSSAAGYPGCSTGLASPTSRRRRRRRSTTAARPGLSTGGGRSPSCVPRWRSRAISTVPRSTGS